MREEARGESFLAAALLAGGLFSFALVIANLSILGTHSSIAASIVLACGVFGAYFAYRRPLVFPFTLYVISIPFNDILTSGAFGTISRLLAVLAAAPLLFSLVTQRPIRKPSKAVTAWIVVLVWMSASTAWAIDARFSWPLLSTFFQLFALFAIVSLVRTRREDFTAVVNATIVGGVMAAAYGLWLFAHGIGVNSDRLFIRSGNNVVDPNHYAASLLVPIGLLTMSLLQPHRLLVKLGLLLPLAAMVAAIYASGSRGALLALALMYGYYFVRSRYRVTLAIVAASIALVSVPFMTDLAARLAIAASSGGAGRLDIWAVAWGAFKAHWLIGAGLANFSLAYDQAFIHVPQAVFEHWHRAPHNLIVSSSVELGVIGLALMLWAWGRQAQSLAELVDSGHPLFDVRIALEGALLGLFVSSMFLDIMYRKYVWLAFMLVALTRSFALEHARRERVVTAARVAEVVPEPASPPPLRPLGAGIDV